MGGGRSATAPPSPSSTSGPTRRRPPSCSATAGRWSWPDSTSPTSCWRRRRGSTLVGAPGRLAAVLAEPVRLLLRRLLARHEDDRRRRVHDPCAVLALTHPDCSSGDRPPRRRRDRRPPHPRHDGHRPPARRPAAAQLRRARPRWRRRGVRRILEAITSGARLTRGHSVIAATGDVTVRNRTSDVPSGRDGGRRLSTRCGDGRGRRHWSLLWGGGCTTPHGSSGSTARPWLTRSHRCRRLPGRHRWALLVRELFWDACSGSARRSDRGPSTQRPGRRRGGPSASRQRPPDAPRVLFHCLVPAAQWWDDIVFT